MIRSNFRILFCLAWILFFFGFVLTAAHADRLSVEETCRAVSAKLASVQYQGCIDAELIDPGSYSNKGVPLLVKEYPPLESRVPQSRVLVIGGTHGDEYSSISIMFRWMEILDVHHSGLFHWIFVPLLNPDGLLLDNSTRTNARGVDINRNFPGPLWREVGYRRWEEYTGKNPRYYPGPYSVSEPETIFLVRLIRFFRPDAIISVHSPLNLVDFDGPGRPPSSIGNLGLRRLGNFPGTLGNFAGIQLGIPVVTLELASSARMPTASEISSGWRDLVRWLIDNTPAKTDSDQFHAVDDLELQKKFFGK